MKKMFMFSFLFSAHLMQGGFCQSVVLTIKDKKILEGFMCFDALTPAQLEQEKIKYPEIYAFFSLMKAKLQEGGDENYEMESMPPSIYRSLSEDKERNIEKWLPEQNRAWLKLSFNSIKRESTIKQRYFDENIKEFVELCDTEHSLCSVVARQYRDDRKQQASEKKGSEAIAKLQKLYPQAEQESVEEYITANS